MNSNASLNISVLIVTYNSAGTIGLCLDSLANQTFTGFEILARDNKSSDDTLKVMENYPNVVVFAGENNIGFGAGVNYLAEKAHGKYLFMLNPDCECPNNLLEAMYEFVIERGGVVAPALEYPDGTSQPSARELPDYRSILYSRRSPLYQLGLVKAADAGYLMPSEISKVPAVSATALLVERAAYLELGGFDKRFFMFGEDLDLSKRLADSDIPVWYLPNLRVKHILGASSSQRPLKSAYYHHRSIYKYFTKHFPRSYIKNSFLMILLAGGFLFSACLSFLGGSRRR